MVYYTANIALFRFLVKIHIINVRFFMRINGWQRLSIVISVAWLLATCGAYFYELKNHPSELATYLPHSAYEWVEDSERTKIEHEKASAEGIDFSHRFVFLKPTFSASGFLLLVLCPIVVGWLTVYLFLYTYGWVKRGFET